MFDWKDWKRWLPKRFSRQQAEEQRTRPAAQRAKESPGVGLTRQATPSPTPMLWNDLLGAERLWADPFGSLAAIERWFGDHAPAVFHPRVDVVDEGRSLLVSAEVPGMRKDDLELTVRDGALVLKGQKHVASESNEEGCYRLERSWGAFERVVPLPRGLDVDHPEAKLDDGVLSVRLAKLDATEDEVKTIAIQ